MSVTIPVNQKSASGNLYVSNGSWSNSTYNIGPIVTANTKSFLQVNGSASFDGDITIQGRSLVKTLEKIEERLAILPPPNEELEQQWEQLHQLRMQYVELERQLLEKQRVFDVLKKQ